MTASETTGRPTVRVESASPVTCGDVSVAASTVAHVSLAQPSPAPRGPVSTRLGDRDLFVLSALGTLRYMTGKQLQRICMVDGSSLTQERRTRSLLRRLTDQKLVVRLDRRVGGVRAGSSGYVYGLSGLGQAAIGIGGPNGGQRRRVLEVKPAFLDHLLAVAEVYCDLVDATRSGAVELLAFEGEPAAWRTFPGASGEAVTLKPDGYARLAMGDIESSAFIEVDLATESPMTLHRKCMTYVSYWRSGIEQAAHEVFPLVAWLTTTEHRAMRIAEVIQRLPGETHRLFDVALLSDVVVTLTTTALGGRMA